MSEGRVYDLNNVNAGISQEEIGFQAFEMMQLCAKGILLPQSYCLPIQVFDDFVQQNNLVDFIINALSEIAQKPKKLEKISKSIQKEILNAKFDSTLKEEVVDLYKRFSGSGKNAVNVRASTTVKELDDSLVEAAVLKTSVFGIDSLFKAIREIWAELFSPAAMQYREDIKYEGPLTLAIIISKEPVAEVSVIAHSLGPIREKDEIELEAILGDIYPLIEGELNGDRYVCRLSTSEILEKNVIEQKWMVVNKFSKGKFQKQKLKISPIWKSKQKLSERQIITTLETTKFLISEYKVPIDAYFAVELGKIYLLEVKKVEGVENMFGEASSNLMELKTKLEMPVEEVDAPVPVAEPAPVPVPDPEKKTIREYVEEVEDILEEEVGGSAKDPGSAQEIIAEKQLHTVLNLYVNNFSKQEYRKFKNNIEGIVGLSGDAFVKKLATPVSALIENKEKSLGLLVNYLNKIVKEVKCPVIYQFASEVYRQEGASFGAARLKGGQSLFEIEIEAVRYLRNKLKFKNLWVTVPFIRSDKEFLEVKKMIYLAKLRRSPSFKIFATIDNPASALITEDLVEAGVDGLVYEASDIARNILGFFSDGESPVDALEKILEMSLRVASDRRVKSIVNSRNVQKSLDIKKLVGYGATGLAVDIKEVMDMKKQLKDIEVARLK